MQQGKTCHWLILGLLFALGCAMPEEGAPSTLTNQVPGTGMLTGEVTAPGAFQAAKVYAKNVDKNIIYMVYTGGGRYQTVAMLPGSYEAWVEKTGFESDLEKIQIEA
ncbi:MAG: carboxypeptidase regulatory-like domain-containing protein [Acidobacteria bacterium]|nr:carboxypeptidase regulatory-like domain-containing protein [Acidobacteriota bacterium]